MSSIVFSSALLGISLACLGAEELAPATASPPASIDPSAKVAEFSHPGQLFGLSQEQWANLPGDLQAAMQLYAERQQALEQASDALLQSLAEASDEAVRNAHRQFQSEHAEALRQLSGAQLAIRKALQQLPADHPAHPWSTLPPPIRDLLVRRAALQQELEALRRQFLKDYKKNGVEPQVMMAERREKERVIRLKLLELEKEANRLLQQAGLAELSDAEKTLFTE